MTHPLLPIMNYVILVDNPLPPLPTYRGVYCALVSALLTNTLTAQLFQGTEHWVTGCQTYEGGFSAVPGTEAHGGYTFCGFAAAVLLKATELVDMRSLLVHVL